MAKSVEAIVIDPVFCWVDWFYERFSKLEDSHNLPINFAKFGRAKSCEPVLVIGFETSEFTATEDLPGQFLTSLTFVLHPAKLPSEGPYYEGEPEWMTTILQLVLEWINEAIDLGAVASDLQIDSITNDVIEDGDSLQWQLTVDLRSRLLTKEDKRHDLHRVS